jgi:hypothetical protein
VIKNFSLNTSKSSPTPEPFPSSPHQSCQQNLPRPLFFVSDHPSLTIHSRYILSFTERHPPYTSTSAKKSRNTPSISGTISKQTHLNKRDESQLCRVSKRHASQPNLLSNSNMMSTCISSSLITRVCSPHTARLLLDFQLSLTLHLFLLFAVDLRSSFRRDGATPYVRAHVLLSKWRYNALKARLIFSLYA